MADTLAIMKISPVIPVVTVDSVEQALSMAGEFHAAGLKIIEITRRTPAGLEAASAIAKEYPDICLGIGTVWDATQARQAIEAGAEFMVSPGITDEVGEVCREANLAYLPGAQTTSEIAYLVRQGWTEIKLFPAAVAGGPAAIKAFSAVFPEVTFCPTGGVSEDNAEDYLALSNVACVGGSWLTKPGDDSIQSVAERAVRLGG
ncbi:bifunctional 4-hydroxy-2-oxoglutarate aldolase/2-dehydro-3-deoxy-phosphogluconate aldolase [Salinisphaera sp. SPP-AMP-43]|uniref:bifunctional 4-hydroxy-2-oxoglutarate aldolase/2-dehydro-3-deoxy-phosphogluconate aldolase n=1 Tax=Salinisphaera sp. SPP-AMP-43 TaxID=3121288 RepID=UPI003C6E205F